MVSSNIVFTRIEFWLIILFSIVLPSGIYGGLLMRRAVSRVMVLMFGVALVVLAGIDVYLLQVLATLSKQTPSLADDAVFVLDTLGELQLFYACADAAFVGGSLQDIGGHNLLEPAAVGTPVVSGPRLHNFADIARQMEAGGALRIGQDADAVGAILAQLLADADARTSMREAGLEMVRKGRGALRRTLEVIGPDLPAAQA